MKAAAPTAPASNAAWKTDFILVPPNERKAADAAPSGSPPIARSLRRKNDKVATEIGRACPNSVRGDGAPREQRDIARRAFDMQQPAPEERERLHRGQVAQAPPAEPVGPL